MKEPIERVLSKLGAEFVESPSGLVERTLASLAPELASIRSRRKNVLWRLSIAAGLALPPLVLLNAAIAWLVYEGLDRVLPEPVAAGTTTLLGAFMLLALALSYGSLPILASLGLRHQETST